MALYRLCAEFMENTQLKHDESGKALAYLGLGLNLPFQLRRCQNHFHRYLTLKQLSACEIYNIL